MPYAQVQAMSYDEGKATTLSPSSTLSDSQFKVRFITRMSAIPHSAVNEFIGSRIIFEKDIFGDDWDFLRTSRFDINDPAVKGRIEYGVAGLTSVMCVKVSDLLKNTGQFGHIGLSGQGRSGDTHDYGTPVIYYDPAYAAIDNGALLRHERDEILQWENLRINVLGISKDKMRSWIKEHVSTTDDALLTAASLKEAGLPEALEGATSLEIADIFHELSYPLDALYEHIEAAEDKGAGEIFDYRHIGELFTRYGEEDNSDVNIAASPSGRKIPDIGKDDVGCYKSELTEYYIGKGPKIEEIIYDKFNLPRDMKGYSKDTFTVNMDGVNIVFYRILNRQKREAWAFSKKDLDNVAILCGLNLRSATAGMGPDDVGCSAPELANHFRSPTLAARTINQTFKLPKPSTYDKSEIIYKDGHREIVIYKRFKNNTFIWAFSIHDLENVAKVCGLALIDSIPDLGSSDIGCSGPGIKKHYTNMQGSVKAIKDVFALPENITSHEDIFTGISGDIKVVFYKRMSGEIENGKKVIWAFDIEDKKNVAKACALTVRSDVQQVGPDDVVCTYDGISKHFFKKDLKNPSPVIEAKFDLPKNVKNCEDDELKRTVEGVEVIFHKRLQPQKGQRNGVYVWVFSISDINKVAKVCGLRVKNIIPELGEGYIGCSYTKAVEYFIGVVEMAAKIRKVFDLPENIKEYEQDHFSGKSGDINVTFYKRMNKSTPLWAFKTEDIDKVAKACELTIRGRVEEITDDYVGISPNKMKKHFININSETMKDIRSKLLLPKTSLYKENEIEKTVNGLNMTFYKKKSGNITIWAFRKIDKEKFANALDLKIREDLETVFDSPGLADAVALFGNDALRLAQYIRIYHPDLSPKDISQVAIRAVNGLGGVSKNYDELHSDYEESLPPLPGMDLPKSTDSHSFELSGYYDPAFANKILVTGSYHREIRIRQDGFFSVSIPLPKTGEENKFEIYAYSDSSRQKSEKIPFTIMQTSEKEDSDSALAYLTGAKEAILESIQKDPRRGKFVMKCIEQSLLKSFTKDSKKAFIELQNRIAAENSSVKRIFLEKVLNKFNEIDKMKFDLNPGRDLYFFQKYIIYEIARYRKENAKGIIVAVDPGLGKTLSALTAINGNAALILTPNPVVSTWTEQEEKFFSGSSLEKLEGTYAERLKAMSTISRPQVVTNIEFMQGMSKQRLRALSRFCRDYLIVDEADYLGSKRAQQTAGTLELSSNFKILLTATPFKRLTQISHILKFLYPDDPAYGSSRAFSRAFSVSSPEDMNALYLLMNENMIRVRKQDVFDEYDLDKPLADQKNRLPRKVEISPEEEGAFELTEEQCRSIEMLFTDYREWCRKHEGHETKEDKEYSRFKEGYFKKKESLRQIMNDPSYIGRDDIGSPKHKKMREIVEKELAEDPSKKVLIFCRYRAQVEKYEKMFQHHGARTFYGGLKTNSQGHKLDSEGRVMYFETDQDRNPVLDENNMPIPTDRKHGRPMLALDYERILFQNNPSNRVMIATYDRGSLGVTMTAADVVIYDDLAPTFRDQYQAGDRAHRIDDDRKKYTVKYYWLEARYPESFLDKLPPKIRQEYFSMGTYDQFQSENLMRQGLIFHRIMDAVGSAEELKAITQKFTPFSRTTEGSEDEEYEDPVDSAEESDGMEYTDEPEEDAEIPEDGLTKGSPARFLISVLRHPELLSALLSEKGEKIREIIEYRKSDDQVHRSSIYKEAQILLALGLLERTDDYDTVKRPNYRFSGAIRGLDRASVVRLIAAINSMEYQIGRTLKPLYRSDIVPGDDREIVHGIIRGLVDSQSAISFMSDDELANGIRNGRVYEIRYDGERLRANCGTPPGEISPGEMVIQEFVKMMKLHVVGADPDDVIKLRNKPSAPGEDLPLISVVSYNSRSESSVFGESKITVEGDISDQPLSITGMLNIAFAGSNIPLDIKEADISEYKNILSFIGSQYKAITGDSIRPDEIIKTLHWLVLPNAERMSHEKIVEYYQLVIEQVQSYA